jgi:hypothetical protein
MLLVATQNFAGVDRLLEAPTPAATRIIDRLGPDAARQFLRFQVSELNRYFFDIYGISQIFMATMLALCLLFATNANRWVLALSVILIILVAAQRFVLHPEITYLGRLLDFVPANSPQPARDRFWSFHIAFSISEILKLLLMAVIGAKLLIRYENRRRILPSETAGPKAAAA